MNRFVKMLLLLLGLGLMVGLYAMLPEARRGGSQSQADKSQADKAITPSSDEGEDKNTALLPDILREKYYFLEINQPIIDFEAEDLNGNKVKLSDYRGKIIILNFWATWCPPCLAEMPHMEEFYSKYKDKDIVILAVNSTSVELKGGTDDKAAEKKVKDFIQQHGYTFPILLDRKNEAWETYYQSGVPTNYIIDRKGIVRYLKIGAFSGQKEMELVVKAVMATEE